MIDRLFVIILNWNLRDDTIACIDSVLKTGIGVGQIIVVDNGSTDGSVEAIRARYHPLPILITIDQNIGFAGGMNHGIRAAIEYGARWLLLLNNDIVVDENMLSEFEKALQDSCENIIYSPLILNYEKPKYISYLGDRRIGTTFITRSLYKGKPASSAFPEQIQLDFITGCAILASTKAFNQIGLFDTSYFMYGEDIDFCIRAQQAGYRLNCVTHARIWHKESASTKNSRPLRHYWRIANQIRFYRTHAGFFHRLLLLIFTFSRIMILGIGNLFKGQASIIPPLVNGWIDGWFKPIPRPSEYNR